MGVQTTMVKKQINEFMLSDTDNHQIAMVHSELYRNTRYAMIMVKELRPDVTLDKTIVDKIETAATFLAKVHSHLDFENEGKAAPVSDKKTDVKENLMKIIECSTALFKIVKPGIKLDSWMFLKLTKASELISSAKHFMEYKAFETHAKDTFSESRGNNKMNTKSKVTKTMEAANARIKLRKVVMEDQELDQAETILAAKDVSSRIQDIAEKIAKISVEDLMSLVDTMSDQFSQEAAQGFKDTVKPALEAFLQSAEQTKTTVDSAVASLRTGGVPAPASDLASTPPLDTPGPAAPPAADPNDQMAQGQDQSQGDNMAPEDDGFNSQQASAGPSDDPTGRAKKESFENRRNSLAEAKKANSQKAEIALLNVKIKELEKDKPAGYKKAIAKIETQIEKLRFNKFDESVKEDMIVCNACANKKSDKKCKTCHGTGKVKSLEEKSKIGIKTSKKINESTPPGFPASLKKKLLKQYSDDTGRAYATMWKIHDQQKEGIEKHAAVLETALATRAKLVENLNKLKRIHKRQLHENMITDPLGVGYGIEGEIVVQEINQVDLLVARLQGAIACLIKQAITELRAQDEAKTTITQMQHIQNTTPYGAVWSDNQGQQQTKFFESESTRNYWLQLNKDSLNECKLINPNHWDKRIAQLTKIVEI
jgi:virulence-associated protein VapD